MHPEEGTTLGYPGCDARLRRLSPGHLADERRQLASLQAACREQLTQFSPPVVDDPQPRQTLRREEKNQRLLDRAAVERARRCVEFHLHLHEIGFYGRTIEFSLYPHLVLCHQLARISRADQWDAVLQRLLAVPAVLEDHGHNLTSASGRGRGPDRRFVEHVLASHVPDIIRFTAVQIPELARQGGNPQSFVSALKNACAHASDAYREHADLLCQRVLPHCQTSAVLGPEETSWRLRQMFAIEEPVASLIARGYRELAEAQRLAVVEANRIGIAATRFEEVVGEFSRRMGECPLGDDEVLSYHRKLLGEALEFLRTHAIFPVPDPCRLEVAAMPPAIVVGTEATNWPAPLFAPQVPAEVRVVEIGAMHPRLQGRNLFVHEGIPGHGLQSLAWRDMFGTQSTVGLPHQLLGFLSIHDSVALTFDEYGSMLNIEGYASHVEERMLEAGYHRGDERLFVRVCQAIRACRVIADLGLHSGTMNPAQAAELFARETGMPDTWIEGQILRYLRCPLQAMTYGLGSWLFADLRTQARAHGLDDPTFYQRVFACGPLSPSAMADILFVDT